jgi:hypothetical protein
LVSPIFRNIKNLATVKTDSVRQIPVWSFEKHLPAVDGIGDVLIDGVQGGQGSLNRRPCYLRESEKNTSVQARVETKFRQNF